MKNKILKKIYLIFLLTFCVFVNSNAEEIKINSTELNILENGNILQGKKGFESYSDTGIEILGDEFEYDKTKNILIAEGNIVLLDKKKDLIIKSNELSYFKNEGKIVLTGKTNINIENKYSIKGSDIVYLKKDNLIYSNTNTEFSDLNNNQIKLKEFNFDTERKIFSGKQAKLFDKNNSEYEFSDFKFNLAKKEFAGKDLSYEMKGEGNEKPRIKGLSIVSDNEISTIYKGVYTTCAKRKGCSPWVIQAKEVVHNKKKKLIDYKNAWLKIYDVPIIYFPRFFHPDPTVKRQSGFLAPTFSESSSLGFSATIPYFYAMAIDKDLTFKPRIFAGDKVILQNEYRQAAENSFHIADFGSLVDNKGTRSHFFVDSQFDYISDYFDESTLLVKIENTTNDTYLNKYSISSPIINDKNVLTSFIDYKASNDDLDLNVYTKIYEDLNKNRSDRYEVIFPYIQLEKRYKNLKLGSTSYYKKNNTNQDTLINRNELLFSSDQKVYNIGTLRDWHINLINLNKDTNQVSDSEKTRTSALGSIIYNLTYPLKKKGEKYSNFLNPKLSLRYSPNKTKNIINEDRRMDLNNIFSLNRLSLFDTIETGESASLGLNYKIDENLSNKTLLDAGLAQVFRIEQNKDLPINSTIGNRSSDVFANLDFSYNDIIDFKSNFSFDDGLKNSKYNYYDLKFNINNFITEFIYLDDDISVDEQGYFDTAIKYNFNKNSSLSYSKRENTKTNLIEYNNIIYEYKLDCLTAGVEYKKKYYENDDIKPEDEIYFSLTISSFGKLSGPNVK